MNRFADTNLTLMLDGLLDQDEADVFDKPMSTNARKLLSNMLTWLHKVNQKDKVRALKIFVSKFDQLVYEDACHKYRLESYPGKRLPAMTVYSQSKSDENVQTIVDYLSLKNLQSKDWVSEHDININGNRVAVATTANARQIYQWLVTNFILIDFSEYDANKIFELGSEKFDLDTIKSAASAIRDQDKRNISYLYAIVRDTALKNSVIKERTKVIEDGQREKLKKIVSYHEHTDYTPQVEDKSEEWKRMQAYLDAIQDSHK